MKLRTLVFWLHLIFAVVTAIVVFIMSITGVALTYQKQMTSWADQRLYRIQAPPGAVQLSPEILVGKLREAMPGANPSNLTLYSDPSKAASVATGPNGMLFLNPYTGEVLGAGSTGMRKFFRVMTDWHRWLALSGEKRSIGKAVTGACNLSFLFLAITGIYLWWPQTWTRRIVRGITWFRLGLSPKGRDFNWHHVFGFWCLVPLILVIASGVVISYPWASNLVFRLAGSEPSFQGGRPGGRPGMGRDMAQVPLQLEGLDKLAQNARNQTQDWQSINFQLPKANDKTVAFTIDTGSGVKPQHRSTVVLDRSSGNIVRSERFEDMDKGIRARLWMRFVHTGEYYGFVGQTIAGIVSVAAVILVYTGLALTFRRYAAWLRRRAEG